MNHGNYCRQFPAIALSIVCLAIPLPALAVENDPGAWIAFSMSDAIQVGGRDTRWHYWVDSQARFFDPGSGPNQFVIRPAIGYKITDNIKGWIGYARILTRNRAGTAVDENRYWQQIDWSAGRVIGGTVSMRARLEQRSVSTGEDIGVVLRVRTKYVRPLRTNGSNSLIIAVEPFVDLRDTDWKGNSRLTQNRTFIGMGWRLGESMSIETGYMNQYIRVDGGSKQSFHHAVINFNVR